MLVVLLGHGTFDGQAAKFNLVGPDLTAADWGAMLGALPGRQVIVNTTEASAPFLDALARQGHHPHHVEGLPSGRWVLLDFVDFVVHLFHPEARAFYQLERLWDDAPALTPHP